MIYAVCFLAGFIFSELLFRTIRRAFVSKILRLRRYFEGEKARFEAAKTFDDFITVLKNNIEAIDKFTKQEGVKNDFHKTP